MGNKAFKHSFQQALKLPIKNKRMGNKGFLAFLTTRNEAAY